MNKRAWNNLSYALLEKDPIKAKKIALKALEFDEEYFQAYDNLGAAQLILGDTVEASKSFKKSIQYKKDNFPALFNYGICLENMAPDSAIFYFQKVLSIHPGHLDARIQLGTILLKSRKYQAAIPHLLIACNADPNNINHFLNLAIAYDKTGNTEKSISLLTNKINSFPPNADLFLLLTNFYGKQQNYPMALIMINKAIELDENPEYYLKRGFVYENAGDYKNAINDYQYFLNFKYIASVEQRIKHCLNSHSVN